MRHREGGLCVCVFLKRSHLCACDTGWCLWHRKGGACGRLIHGFLTHSEVCVCVCVYALHFDTLSCCNANQILSISLCRETKRSLQPSFPFCRSLFLALSIPLFSALSPPINFSLAPLISLSTFLGLALSFSLHPSLYPPLYLDISFHVLSLSLSSPLISPHRLL